MKRTLVIIAALFYLSLFLGARLSRVNSEVMYSQAPKSKADATPATIAAQLADIDAKQQTIIAIGVTHYGLHLCLGKKFEVLGDLDSGASITGACFRDGAPAKITFAKKTGWVVGR